MKAMRNTLFLLMLCLGATAIAQGDKNSCPGNLSIFAEFAKVKNYDSAYQPWKEVRTICPELNVATFMYGERILTHKFKNATVDKALYQQELISLYDDWETYFP